MRVRRWSSGLTAAAVSLGLAACGEDPLPGLSSAGGGPGPRAGWTDEARTRLELRPRRPGDTVGLSALLVAEGAVPVEAVTLDLDCARLRGAGLRRGDRVLRFPEVLPRGEAFVDLRGTAQGCGGGAALADRVQVRLRDGDRRETRDVPLPFEVVLDGGRAR